MRVFLPSLSGVQSVYFLRGIMMSSVASLALPYFSKIFGKKKKPIEHKIRVLIYSATLTAKFLILRTIQRDIVINVHGSLCKVPVIPVRF